jgi:hypothetical protein
MVNHRLKDVVDVRLVRLHVDALDDTASKHTGEQANVLGVKQRNFQVR